MEFQRANQANEEYVANFIKFGKKLLNQKKKAAWGKWKPFLTDTYGESNIRNCQNAMFLARQKITAKDHKLGIHGLLEKFRDKKLNRTRPKPIKMKAASKKFIKKFKFRSNPNKQIIEDIFLNAIGMYIQSPKCLTLSGPDYKRHVDKLIEIGASEIFIVEKNQDIFRSLLTLAYRCEHHQAGKVNLLNCDVGNVVINNCHYIDLDLMATIQKITPIIENHLTYQSCMVDGIKALSFTSSLRRSGNSKERFKSIQKLLAEHLDCNLTGFDGTTGSFGEGISLPGSKTGLGSYCVKHIPTYEDPGRVVELHMFIYSDTSPMITMLVIYK